MSSGRGGVETVARLRPDDLLAARADPDQDDGDADELGDEVQVVASGLWEVGERAVLEDG